MYKQAPLYEWDEEKRAANLRDHGVDFANAYHFDWETAVITIDDREDYGELREMAYGCIGVRLHAMAFTRRGDKVRIISLRKANGTEVRRYVDAIDR
jgi:uncharacterized DUF497 family protein